MNTEHRNKFGWFPFYPDDFFHSPRVKCMTLGEIGAYLTLLCYAWREPYCALTANHDDLKTLAGWKTAGPEDRWERIVACFPKHPMVKKKVHNPRLYREWMRAREISGERSLAAKKRWEQHETQDKNPSPSPRPVKAPRILNGTGVWEAYATAYTETYSVPPTRNAKTNALCAKFVTRVGIADAPVIAAWYLSHRAQLYVQAGHCLELLLRDAEKLRTEWTRGQTITTTRARQLDQGSAMQQGVQEAKAILDRHKTAKEPSHD